MFKIGKHPAAATSYAACYDPTVMMVLKVASTAMSVISSIKQGNDQQKLLNRQAEQAEIDAGQKRAVGQRDVIAVKQRGEDLKSRARALAAASGAGSDDPTMEQIFGDIGARTEHDAMMAMYNAESGARRDESQADAWRYEGKMASRAGMITGLGTAISGGLDAYDKYGTKATEPTGLARYGYSPGRLYADRMSLKYR